MNYKVLHGNGYLDAGDNVCEWEDAEKLMREQSFEMLYFWQRNHDEQNEFYGMRNGRWYCIPKTDCEMVESK